MHNILMLFFSSAFEIGGGLPAHEFLQIDFSGVSGWLWFVILLVVILIVWALLIFQSSHDSTQEMAPMADVRSGLPVDDHGDDLTVIEGIGPKISELLNKEGIKTYNQLAATDPRVLRTLLADAGYRLAFPETWPEQARIAFSGDSAALNTFQDQLKAGRAIPDTSDDLTLIEGIGPKISELLQNEGINTFAKLADTDTGKLEEILTDANLRFAKPGTWSRQARLAVDGDWEKLSDFQERLKGGKEVG